MDTATLAALRSSIEHWKENEQVTDIIDAKIGTGSCALCKLFFRNLCKDCPVFNRTGKDLCVDTPYRAVVEAKEENNLEAFRLAAKAEREFLESLLPKE